MLVVGENGVVSVSIGSPEEVCYHCRALVRLCAVAASEGSIQGEDLAQGLVLLEQMLPDIKQFERGLKD